MNCFHRGRRAAVVFLSSALLIAFESGCSNESKLARHLERADAMYDAGETESAAIEYLNALRLDVDQPRVIARLAVIYFDQGKFQEAVPFLNETKKRDPDNLDVRVKLATLMLAGRQFDAVREETEYVLDRSPTNRTALLLFSDSAQTLEDVDASIVRLKQIEHESGESAALHAALGNLYLRRNDQDSAEAAFKDAIRLDPDDSGLYLRLATVLWRKQENATATEAFEKAIELADTDPRPQAHFAEFKFRTGDMEGGKSLLDQTITEFPEYAPSRLLRSEIALNERKLGDAAEVLKPLFQQNTNHLTGRILQARIQLAEGDPPRAIANLEQLKPIHPQSAQLHYQLAAARVQNRELSQAVADLDQALEASPNYTDAKLLLAEVKLRQGDAASAITALSELIERQPDLARAHLLLADAYLAVRTPDEAVAVYRRLMDMAPDNALVPFLMGLTMRQQGNAGDAKDAFQKTLDLAPDYLPALAQLVQLSINQKDFDGALERVQAEIDRKPNTPEPHYLRASILLAQEETEAAEAALLKCIEIEPEFRAAYLALASLYIRSDQTDQALERLNRILENDPNDVVALMQVGMIHDAKHEYEKAQSAYERLLQTNAEFPPALNNLAYLYAEKLGRLDDAYKLATQARQLSPNDPFSGDTLGWILHRKGEYAWALSLLQESATKLPTQAEVAYHLGMTHYMMGEEDAARVALQRALELSPDFPGRPEAQEYLATLETAPTDPAEAKANLTQRLQDKPDDLVAMLRLGELFEAEGNADQALDLFKRANGLNPKSASTVVAMARVHSGLLNQPVKAMELARQARTLAVGNADLVNEIGKIALRAGDTSWALSLLEEAARSRGPAASPDLELGLAYYRMGRIDDARDTMQEIVQAASPAPSKDDKEPATQFLEMIRLYENPVEIQARESDLIKRVQENDQDLPARVNLAVLAERKGELAEARRIYESILAKFPEFALAQKHLAGIYAQPGPLLDIEKAYQAGVKARAAYPNDPGVAATFGKIVFQRGNAQYATQLLSEASRQLTANAEIQLYLGKALLAQNQTNQAQQAFTKAVSLGGETEVAREARAALQSVAEVTSDRP